jgi:hypothetical protein
VSKTDSIIPPCKAEPDHLRVVLIALARTLARILAEETIGSPATTAPILDSSHAGENR